MTSDSGRVLVTGASGFLARHLLPKLPRSLALVRDGASFEALPFRCELGATEPVAGSLENWQQWCDGGRLGPVSTIVHLAALVRHTRRDADEVYRANVDGTLAMVRAAARLGARLVFVSTTGTVACFRTPDALADEDAPFCQQEVADWPYYDSKIRAEVEASKLAKELSVPLVIVRIPVILGPGDHRGRSTAHIRKLLAGKLPFLVAGGIAYADVRDVADGLVALVHQQAPRPVYHLTGTNCSLDTFFALCAKVGGVKAPTLHLPKAVGLALSHVTNAVCTPLRLHSPLPDPVVVEMASRYWGATTRYAHELGYASRPAEATLADTIAWLRSR